MRLRTAQIAYLDQVVDATGMTLTQIARGSGMNSTTLTRFRNNDERGGTLALPSLSAVAAYSRVPLPPDAVGDTGEGGLREPEAVPFKAEQGDTLSELVRTYLTGRPSFYAVTVKARSLEYRGIRPGDVLIMDLNGNPAPGDVVIAQFYDWQAPAQTETVLRIYNPPILSTAGPDDGEVDRPRLIEDRSVGIKGVMMARVGGRLGRFAA